MIHNTIKRKQRGPSRTEGSRCFRCGVCKEKIGGNGKGSGRLFQGRGGLCRAAGSVALQPSRQHKGHGAQCGAQDKDDVKAAGQVVQVGETGAGKREHQAAYRLQGADLALVLFLAVQVKEQQGGHGGGHGIYRAVDQGTQVQNRGKLFEQQIVGLSR